MVDACEWSLEVNWLCWSPEELPAPICWFRLFSVNINIYRVNKCGVASYLWK